ncbi:MULTISPECIES: hypothetical protein [unclassified Pseudobutyrivibrio]|jgi:hypothetical protein|uniref:hypothetical protein n=1 Tax=unclassified Pseudobutyrivibrio TaxID=2638619 RepID=UPI0008820CB1|nr:MULTISPECIES: hypothetical protein [unclassified Pseudobutyrivibrio]MBR5953214.1 hypothetical protein [Pseudobutyrivibrio sp.]SCY04068.1 hypothetical protein SAMN05660668_01228 [Pseudobutyrivibrio sp. AR14]
MYDLTGKTIVEIKDYVNSLSNEELDKFIEEVDFADYDFDLEALDLLTSSRLYDYIQYSHGGEAEITFD